MARRIYVVLALLAGTWMIFAAWPRIFERSSGRIWDFVSDYRLAKAFTEHYDPYSPAGAERAGLTDNGPSGTGHPPTTPFWFLPLTKVGLNAASASVQVVSLFGVLVVLVILAGWFKWPGSYATAWLLFGYLVGCDFMTYHIAVGQLSAAIAVLLAMSWMALRNGEDALAGVALGVACTLKLFPGLLGIPLVLGRRWRAVGWALAVYGFVALYMTAGYGLVSWREFLAVQPKIADIWMDNIQNQSIQGIVLRIFHPACGPHGPVIAAATAIAVAISLGLVGLSAWWSRSLVRGEGELFDLPFALFTLLAVFTSQWAWEHYAILFVTPMAILVEHTRRAARGGMSRASVFLCAISLASVLASWRMDRATKFYLQAAVREGDLSFHVRLHVFEVLNWLPLLVLVTVALALLHHEHRARSSGAGGGRDGNQRRRSAAISAAAELTSSVPREADSS